MKRSVWRLMLLGLWLIWGASAPAAELNAVVLAKAESYPDGGGYQKEWKGSGTVNQIKHRGEAILPKGTGGTYCSGFTFTVVMDVLSGHHLITGRSAAEIRQFQRTWYGAGATDEAGREQQCQKALTDLGLGQKVDLKAARPGDFIQFWRDKSGHSAVLVAVVQEAGEPVGITYRSSQGNNGQGQAAGVGTRTERFQGHGGKVNPARIYLVRLTDGRAPH